MRAASLLLRGHLHEATAHEAGRVEKAGRVTHDPSLSSSSNAPETTIELAALIAVGTVALSHFAFLVLEMALWTRPSGRRIFGLSEERATVSAPLAMNQGLYNGFLGAGLIWGMLATSSQLPILVFFLTCVIIAGVFGAITVSRSILVVQALPGVVALILSFLAFG